MAQMQLKFIKGDRFDRSTDFRDALPVNMSGVARSSFGSQGYLLETPGMDAFGTGIGVDRGGLWNERLKNHYRLSGDKFISVSSTGVSTVLGTIEGADQASLPYSFSTQGIIANNQFWLYDPVDGMQLVDTISDPNISNPIDGVWIDGYYCLTNGSYIYHTKIVAGVPVENEINPLAVAVESFSPNPTIGVGRSVDNKWLVFARYVIAAYEDVGGDTFAFQRIDGREFNVGLVSTHAKATLDDIWFFVGSRKYEALSVYAMSVGAVTKIATREIEKILSKYTDSQLSRVVAEPRQYDGYSYLIIHLPKETLMYNYTLANLFGNEYAWSILSTGRNSLPWRSINGIFDPRIGSWIYGDLISANLGKMDIFTCTQYGEVQEWYLDTEFLKIETASVDMMEIMTAPGFADPDNDATVFLSLSFDGESYTNEVPVKYGDQGQYLQRFIARRLGYIRNFFKIRLRGCSKSRMMFSMATISYG